MAAIDTKQAPAPQGAETASSEPASRSRGPSLATFVAIAVTAVALKESPESISTAPDPSIATITIPNRIQIQATRVVAEDPQHQAVVRKALDIVDDYPACQEARAFFTTAQREIVIKEIDSKEGDTVGYYRPIAPDTIVVNSKVIDLFLKCGRVMGLNDKDSQVLAALGMVGTLCHESGHATDDRLLDSIAERALGYPYNVVPIFIEDEALCRLKGFRVEEHMQRLARIAFPECPERFLAILRLDTEEHSAFVEKGEAGLIRRLDSISSSYADLDTVHAAQNHATWHMAARHPELQRAVLTFYTEATQRAVQELSINTPEEQAAWVHIGAKLLAARDLDVKYRAAGLRVIKDHDGNLPTELQLGQNAWEAIINSCTANISLDFEKDVLRAQFDPVPENRVAACLRCFDRGTWDAESTRRYAKEAGVLIGVSDALGTRMENQLREISDQSSYAAARVRYALIDSGYIPKDPEVFAKCVVEMLPTASRQYIGFDRLSTEGLEWVLSGAKQHDLGAEANVLLSRYYQSRVTEPPHSIFQIENELPVLHALQTTLNAKAKPLQDWARLGISQIVSSKDGLEAPSLLRSLARDLPELLPEATRVIKEHAEDLWPIPKTRRDYLAVCQNIIDAADNPAAESRSVESESEQTVLQPRLRTQEYSESRPDDQDRSQWRATRRQLLRGSQSTKP